MRTISRIAVLCLFAVSCAHSPVQERHRGKVGDGGDESKELEKALAQFSDARTAPGLVQPGGYSAAFSALTALPEKYR